MKHKFSHEEIIVTSVVVACCASMVYLFGALLYNALIIGI